MALRATVPAATWGCAGHDPARRAVRPDRSVTRAHARTRARAQTQTPTDPLHCHEERGLAEGGGRCAADSRIGHGGSRARLRTPGNDAAEQARSGYHEHPRAARGPQRAYAHSVVRCKGRARPSAGACRSVAGRAGTRGTFQATTQRHCSTLSVCMRDFREPVGERCRRRRMRVRRGWGAGERQHGRRGGGGKGEREGGPLLSLSRAPTALGQCPLRRAEVYGSGHNSSDKTLYCRTLLVKLGFSCAGVKRSYYHYYYARETFTFCKALGQRGTVAKPFLLL